VGQRQVSQEAATACYWSVSICNRDPEGSSKKYKQGGGGRREGAPCKGEEVEREKAGFAAADGFEKPENLGGVA